MASLTVFAVLAFASSTAGSGGGAGPVTFALKALLANAGLNTFGSTTSGLYG